MTPFYVALGDSMSIDLYPRLELEGRGALSAGSPAAVGAASLLHRNHDSLWPAFEGRDLATGRPELEKVGR